MPSSWRRSLFTAVFLILTAASAAAQTVIVTNAPVGGKVEVVFAGQPAGSATVDASRVVTISIPTAARREMDARVYVDVCGENNHRILIMERSQLPPARDEGCDRREIPGIFWVRPVNSLAVNVGGAIPTLLLVRGRYDPNNPTPVKRAPRGLVLFGGGGLIGFNDVAAAACGTVQDCRQDGTGAFFSGGAAFWILPWLSAEGSYLRPSKLTTAGGDFGFDFTTTFDVHIFSVVANAGVAAGPVRIYGKVGGNFHRSTTTTRQTANSETQTIEIEADGWGPIYGGGFEGWIKPRFALYAEGLFGKLKGDPLIEDVEGRMNEGFQYFVVGARVKLF